MIRVLILGGYGVFGARLARLLDRDPAFDITIAGRDRAKADALARALPGPATKRAAAIDKAALETALKEARPDFLVHCAGPFQGQDYAVANTCIAQGVHYADLSDGRAFTQGFAALDEAAQEAGVFALTAASTTSALSTAAALAMAHRLARVDQIRVGVTPGNRAPRGRAVVEAILGYAGEPIPWRADGADALTTGWGGLRRASLPGLGTRWFSPCDAPDMAVMPRLFPAVRDIEFYGGLELSVLHLSLYGLAQLRRRRLVPNLAGGASFFCAIANLLSPFGSDRGGMFVELAGESQNRTQRRVRWSLYAGSGDGPNIPAMATAALARRLAAGDVVEPGARACAGEVSLEDFNREFSAFDIQTQTEAFDGESALPDAVGRGVRRAA